MDMVSDQLCPRFELEAFEISQDRTLERGALERRNQRLQVVGKYADKLRGEEILERFHIGPLVEVAPTVPARARDSTA